MLDPRIRIKWVRIRKPDFFYEQVTQREKVVNMPVVNKTRHLEQELTGGHKMPEDQMKKVHTFFLLYDKLCGSFRCRPGIYLTMMDLFW
jgi:hypothetical protein